MCQYKEQDQDDRWDGVDEVAHQPLSERSRHFKDIQTHKEEESYKEDEEAARCPVEEGFHRESVTEGSQIDINDKINP